jgi:hypothetical protein
MKRPLGLTVIACAAVIQGAWGFFRAFEWFQQARDVSGRGIIVLPIVSAVLFVRGALIGVIALLYILFALGVFTGRRWAWALGLAAAALNLVIVLLYVLEGQELVLALLLAVVPVVLLCYLLASAGRRAFTTPAVREEKRTGQS